MNKYLQIANRIIAGTVLNPRVAYIKKHGPHKYEVKSKNNPEWSGGTYKTRAEAEERLQQVEMFKSMTQSGTKKK